MIHRSLRADIVVPNATIAEFVFSGLTGREDQPAMIDGLTGRVMNGAELIDASRRFAGALAARGIGPGKVVALMAPNCPEFAVVFYGTSIAGATITTVNPSYTAQELRHQLDDSGATLLVVPPGLLPLAADAAAGTAVNETVILAGEGEGATAWGSALSAAPIDQVPLDPVTAIVALPYSSGTTGLPKGVMLTHRNLVANIEQVRVTRDTRPGDAFLAVLPYFHIYGMQILMNYVLACGGVAVTLPRFDLPAVLKLVETYRMRHLFVVPPVVLALAKHPLVDQHDLSSLEYVNSGAAPLGADLSRACADRLGCEMTQGYGMTETSPATHLTPVKGALHGSSGELVAGTEARIMDPETGRDMAPGTEGELWVRGPQVMAGYHNNPEATTRTITPDGWLRTGDLARVDDTGNLWIVDRVKELIKVKGFQVAPAELEGLLLTHPAVADCAVIGRPDDEAGEVPVAFVVRREGSLTEAEVQAHIAGQVANYKALRAVHFTDTIPKSPSGKILRRVLRAQA